MCDSRRPANGADSADEELDHYADDHDSTDCDDCQRAYELAHEGSGL